jgi:hypothetical protein
MASNARDVANSIKDIIENAINDAVEQAIDNVDMDDKISCAIDNYDLEDKISDAINNFDFSDVISEDTVKDNVDIKEIVSDVAGDIISDSVNKLRNELLEYVSGLVADHSMLLDFEVRLQALEGPKNSTSTTRLWDRIRMWFASLKR